MITFGTHQTNATMKIKSLLSIFFISCLLLSCNLVDSITGNDDEATQVELYPVLLDGQWGYIDKEGRIKIEPQYQIAGAFKDGLAAVRYRWDWKYINSNGDFVVEGEFWNLGDFNEVLAPVRIDDRWGYINKKGNFEVNPRFRSAYAFSDGRAFVRSIDYSEYYYIDTNGNKIESTSLPEDMDFVEENTFSNGRALVRDDELYGFIDKDGNTVIELKYSEARSFSDNLAAVRISDKWGFISDDGAVSISPQFISVGDFGNGLAPARKATNQFGFINKNGELVIEEQFDDVGIFTEERAPVMINDRWTFIDKTGQLITSSTFDEVESFFNGLARITIYVPIGEEIEEHYGYINKSGEYVWYPTN